jgi:hypothetical protein
MWMSIIIKTGVFLVLGLLLLLPEVSHSQEAEEIELISVGIRAGRNLGGIPPEEKSDFYQFDVFSIFGFPGGWEWSNEWEGRYLWYLSAGVLRGGGENGFISTTGPGVRFTKRDWNVSLEFGTGLAFLSRQHYDDQDTGGHVQIVGQGGIFYHFPENIVAGWRFQHFSDAAIYGSNNRGVDIHLFELSYQF